jgi:hypothetical protein
LERANKSAPRNQNSTQLNAGAKPISVFSSLVYEWNFIVVANLGSFLDSRFRFLSEPRITAGKRKVRAKLAWRLTRFEKMVSD